MSDKLVIGIIVSILYIGLVFAIGYLFEQKYKRNSFYIRKLIHIAMANWWIIHIIFFTDFIWVVLFPVFFIGVNFFLTRKVLFQFMSSEAGYGTCYFAIALTIMVLVGFLSKQSFVAATASIFTLGYGDAVAAMMGKRFGRMKTIINSSKTYLGSLFMFLTSALIYSITILFFDMELSVFTLLLFAGCVTLFELISIKGIDDLLITLSGYGVIMAMSGVNNEKIGMIILLFFINLVIVLVSYKKRALTPGGAVCSFFVGMSIYLLGGLFAYSIMIAFYAGAVFAEHLVEKKIVGIRVKEARDLRQILANSIWSCIAILTFFITKEIIFLCVYATIFAECFSDTLASSIGRAYGRETKYLINRSNAPKGLSGGVSRAGCIAGAIGAAIVALLLFGYLIVNDYEVLVSLGYALGCGIIGYVGMIVDSILGEVFQVKYRCDVCDKISEHEICHETNGRIYKGFRMITNNTVNLMASFITGIFVFGILRVITSL